MTPPASAPPPDRPRRRQGAFFGWWVVLAFAAMTFMTSGSRFSIGPFLKPMVAELGLARASFSLVVAVNLLLYGLFSPFVTPLASRFGARRVVVVGTLLLAGSLGATGFAANGWELYVTYGVSVALGLAATGNVVASAVVSRWFTKRRATALSYSLAPRWRG